MCYCWTGYKDFWGLGWVYHIFFSCFGLMFLHKLAAVDDKALFSFKILCVSPGSLWKLLSFIPWTASEQLPIFASFHQFKPSFSLGNRRLQHPSLWQQSHLNVKVTARSVQAKAVWDNKNGNLTSGPWSVYGVTHLKGFRTALQSSLSWSEEQDRGLLAPILHFTSGILCLSIPLPGWRLGKS